MTARAARRAELNRVVTSVINSFYLLIVTETSIMALMFIPLLSLCVLSLAKHVPNENNAIDSYPVFNSIGSYVKSDEESDVFRTSVDTYTLSGNMPLRAAKRRIKRSFIKGYNKCPVGQVFLPPPLSICVNPSQ